MDLFHHYLMGKSEKWKPGRGETVAALSHTHDGTSLERHAELFTRVVLHMDSQFQHYEITSHWDTLGSRKGEGSMIHLSVHAA